MDGHARVWVDDDAACRSQHGTREPPIYHVTRNNGTRYISATVVRCPRSLSSQERAKLKEQK